METGTFVWYFTVCVFRFRSSQFIEQHVSAAADAVIWRCRADWRTLQLIGSWSYTFTVWNSYPTAQRSFCVWCCITWTENVVSVRNTSQCLGVKQKFISYVFWNGQCVILLSLKPLDTKSGDFHTSSKFVAPLKNAATKCNSLLSQSLMCLVCMSFHFTWV
jgi:hypothetical protein